ncbi:MAG: D-alanine--D-alanine ligase [Candidatus Omnitrophica bacterium]|nr:D-alanine--D-alanine ligase [Candidatus Omnitrophota bacterium]
MNIGLTFNLQTNPADERQAEFDPPATIEALTRALETLGHAVIPLGGAEALRRAPQQLREVELVFNIAEGAEGRCREAQAPILLDLFGVPYVGSDALALAVGLDKVMCKRIARAEGIATPSWITVERPSDLPRTLPCTFPVIVKPRWEGSGRGIDAGAVVSGHASLEARAAWLFQRCPEPMLIEEFVPGGELTVCVIGNEPPIAYPAIQRPLDPASRLSCHVVRPAPAHVIAPLTLDEMLEVEAQHFALTMCRALGCRDVARVDLRVDGHGRAQFLEINPLPSFDPEGSLGLLAESLGRTYADLIGDVLSAACARYGITQVALR